jgi:hypothetical protein
VLALPFGKPIRGSVSQPPFIPLFANLGWCANSAACGVDEERTGTGSYLAKNELIIIIPRHVGDGAERRARTGKVLLVIVPVCVLTDGI